VDLVYHVIPYKTGQEDNMGVFKFQIQATGNHGCKREIKSGDKVEVGCGLSTCVDCACREFVEALRRKGVYFSEGTKDHAILRHWPETESEVVDDLLTKVRTGGF
jgi:hypothetical protein